MGEWRVEEELSAARVDVAVSIGHVGEVEGCCAQQLVIEAPAMRVMHGHPGEDEAIDEAIGDDDVVEGAERAPLLCDDIAAERGSELQGALCGLARWRWGGAQEERDALSPEL